MKGSTHIIIGTTTTIFAAILTSQSQSIMGMSIYPVALIPLGAMGALSADIDMEGNPSGRALKFPLWLIRKLPFLKKALEHRGFTHTLVIPALAFLFTTTVASSGEGWPIKLIVSMLLGWIIGYISHVVSDILNGKGVPIMWPCYFKRVHLMSITTETFEEILFLVGWLIFIISHTVLNYLGMNL